MTYLLYAALPYIVSLPLIIHCIKTGRSWIWVFVMLFLPLLGALAYTAVEILPELVRGRTGHRAARGLKKAIDPFGDLRRFQQEPSSPAMWRTASATPMSSPGTAAMPNRPSSTARR
ncbi:conserved hypothetical protein, membrane [mine drainage metagenome]|uniref:Uncharacterized protein n=1 Tax=mine drainage metagenome TaxID=410659 RepID=T1CIZ0_9ZZZZ